MHAVLCLFFQQLIRASSKLSRENVFATAFAFMHIGLLLTIRKTKLATSAVMAEK
jgi:DMSO reductase anchor subunit